MTSKMCTFYTVLRGSQCSNYGVDVMGVFVSKEKAVQSAVDFLNGKSTVSENMATIIQCLNSGQEYQYDVRGLKIWIEESKLEGDVFDSVLQVETHLPQSIYQFEYYPTLDTALEEIWKKMQSFTPLISKEKLREIYRENTYVSLEEYMESKDTFFDRPDGKCDIRPLGFTTLMVCPL